MKKFCWIVFLVLISSFTGNAQIFSLLKDIAPGTNSSVPDRMISMNGSLFFSLSSGGGLWKSDGTSESTVLIKGGFNSVDYFTVVNGNLFFSAKDATHGVELWKSDGTEAGTVMVKDIIPGSYWGSPRQLVAVGDILYFRAMTLETGLELWKSDGTEAGTVLVRDINPGPASHMYASYDDPTFKGVGLNGLFFFGANDGTNGFGLWKTDGTETGTAMVKVVGGSPMPSSFNVMDNKVFFVADGGLWRSDGTTSGTTLVTGCAQNTAYVQNIVKANSMLFLGGQELKKTNGVVSSVVKNVSAQNLFNVNGTVFFLGNTGLSNAGLWKSDGTTAGTVLVSDKVKQIGYYHISISTAGNALPGNILLFGNDDGEHGHELWRSDGTANGTYMIQDFMPGSPGAAPLGFEYVNGKAFVGLNTPEYGKELWVASIAAQSLPLTLSAFKAQLSANDGLLNWKTSSEQNTSHFEIERSFDGRNFTKTTTISASGNSSIEKLYSYTDKNITSLGTSVVYYRLKMMDVDGKFTYSKIIAININNKEAVVMFYPNPVRENATLMIAAAKKENLVCSIIDHSGRIIRNTNIAVEKGSNSIIFETNSLAAGVYTFSIKGQVTNTQLKFVRS